MQLFQLLISTACFAASAWAAQGCKPRTEGTPGFDMSLYHYPYADVNAGPGFCFSSEYEKPSFQQGGYETYGGGLFGTATDIDDVTLEIRLTDLCTPAMGTLSSNFNYGETFTISNFTMLLTGYFLPQKTGTYKFTLWADDLAYMSFGDGNAFDCCGEEGSVSDPEKFDLIVLWRAADDMSGTVSYQLEEGVYYPLRILYANRDYHGDLKLAYEDPDGVTRTDFTDHIYQFKDEPEGCPNNVKTSTTLWTGSYTTTAYTTVYTTTGSDGVGTTETLYVVVTPDTRTHVQTATSVISTGTVTATTTVSTATGVVTGTDGIITTETTYFIEEPSKGTTVATATSVYSTGTGSVTTTVSTAVGVTTGTDGVVTSETTYFIEEPSTGTTVATATTVYSTGTVTEVTTVSTATGVYTGTDGVVTSETTYFIEEPSTQESETQPVSIATVWPVVPTIAVSFPEGGIHTVTVSSVTVPTTFTTVVTYETTDSDGNTEELTATDTIIEIPEPETSSETPEPESTITTETSSEAPEPESTITTETSSKAPEPESTIATETSSEAPEPETTITTEKTTTEFGSVTAPTTETHVTTYYTSISDGEEEIVETDIEVEIPEPETTITTAETTTDFGSVTSPTTKTHVTTYYTTNSSGEEEEIVKTDVDVELPSVEETVTTATTSYTIGTGSVTTTVATIVTTYYTTNSNGEEEEVIETEYVVEIPDVDETITTATTETSYYTGSVTTTLTRVTTFLTTDANGNEEEVIETEIIVEIPEKIISTTSIIDSYYTGSITSTYSTNIRTYTTTDGQGHPEQVIETDYYVLIPQGKSVSQYPQATTNPTTTHAVTEYHGVGATVTGNVFTFITGLLFATLFI